MGSDVLTAVQAEVWSLRREKRLTFKEIAERRGTKEGSAYRTFQQAVRKLGADAIDEPLTLPGPADRLAIKSEELNKAVSEAGDQTTIRLAEHRRAEALVLMDRPNMAQESAKSLAQIVAGLTNVIQLLRGEPTAITKFLDIRKLDELAEMFNKEAARRGKLIDVTPDPEGG